MVVIVGIGGSSILKRRKLVVTKLALNNLIELFSSIINKPIISLLNKSRINLKGLLYIKYLRKILYIKASL